MPQYGYKNGVDLEADAQKAMQELNTPYQPAPYASKSQEILQQLAQLRERQASPAYQGVAAGMQESGSGDNALMASLARAGAQVGTLRGRASDTSSVDQMAQAMEQQRTQRLAQGDRRQMANAAFDETRLKSAMNQDELAKDQESQRFNVYKDKISRAENTLKRVSDLKNKQMDRDIAADYRNTAKEEKSFAREQSRDDRLSARDQKLSEKDYELKTPYGPANTVQDAKDLKEAHISKASFDSKLNELIALRKSKGGELFDREAVARGKQLSKDLLLEYKNMAKLGVLSQSDTDIINAIIPSDPLEFSVSGLAGQDPISYKMQKFKEDSDKDFNTRVQTRTRAGKTEPLAQVPQEGEVKLKGGIKWIRKNGAWEELQEVAGVQ